MAKRTQPVHLSKTRYTAGLQCQKRLWLTCHDRKLGTKPDAALQAIFEQGTEVGLAAHKLFPGGVHVQEKPWEHARAVERTRALMQSSEIPAIFEAAFEAQNVRIRVDVLERLSGGGWGLREVKSSAGVKDIHFDDIAVQHFVLESSGVRVPSVELLHVNRDYVRREGGIDWPAFFVRADLTAESTGRLAEVPRTLERFESVLGQSSSPAIAPGHHCNKPFACEFWDHCTSEKPADWVFHLPYLSSERFQSLEARGVDRIGEVPADFSLSAAQARICEVHRSGRPYRSPSLASVLERFGPPAYYLDFEAMNPAIPLYPGTRPFQMIPFQWSIHHVQPDGEDVHHEFLADGRSDPRRSLAEALVQVLSRSPHPVVVYSSFERTQLRGLAEAFPDLADALLAIEQRLCDLFPVVRENVYDAAFRGSFSLKAVAPALASEVTYDDLDAIAAGSAAATAMLRIARDEVSGPEEAHLRRALLTYCKRDTLALLEVHRSLRAGTDGES